MEQNTNRFLESWTEEFSRAVEMFTAERPVVSYAGIEGTERELADYLWWQQTVGAEESFVIWVGAEQPCWSALGNALDDGSDAKQMYLEMLGQATQGAAAVAGAGFATPLRCGEGSVGTLASLDPFELAEVKITFRNGALPPVVLAIEASAERILDEPRSPAGKQQHTKLAAMDALNSLNSPMLDRLMDVQLPVSVLLGRAVLSVREVLKISPGSVIELDRQIEDYVEVVVHGTVVARGEIVSVRGNYGVRIKEVISHQDRIALKDAA
jgi:flagellar motor switch protein FliN/FliY